MKVLLNPTPVSPQDHPGSLPKRQCKSGKLKHHTLVIPHGGLLIVPIDASCHCHSHDHMTCINFCVQSHTNQILPCSIIIIIISSSSSSSSQSSVFVLVSNPFLPPISATERRDCRSRDRAGQSHSFITSVKIIGIVIIIFNSSSSSDSILHCFPSSS